MEDGGVAEMASFLFDPDKSFPENLEAFFVHVGNGNAEMAKILRGHAPLLDGAQDDAQRRALRAKFNGKVKADLEGLQAKASIQK